MQWIECKKRMPDDQITVIIYCPGGEEPIWFGYHDGDEGWRTVDGALVKVTHWMDFPPPPAKTKPLNSKQLSCLRHASASGEIHADRCTGKALRDRGFAVETLGGFFINQAGLDRARFAADIRAKTTFEGKCDESLMKDI